LEHSLAETFTNVWDETQPPDTQAANLLGQDIRSLKTDIRERMIAFAAGLDADKPTTVGPAFGSANDGVMFFATDTGQIYRFNGTTWVNITASFFSGQRVFRSTPGYLFIGGVGAGAGNLQTSVPLGTITGVSIVNISINILLQGLNTQAGSAVELFTGADNLFEVTPLLSGSGTITANITGYTFVNAGVTYIQFSGYGNNSQAGSGTIFAPQPFLAVPTAVSMVFEISAVNINGSITIMSPIVTIY
jgi:hypothetical protein